MNRFVTLYVTLLVTSPCRLADILAADELETSERE